MINTIIIIHDSSIVVDVLYVFDIVVSFVYEWLKSMPMSQMSKGKSKKQKKEFFGKKLNRGKVFKKKDVPPKPSAPPLRERGRFELVHDYDGDVQSCSHGPCLLFLDRKASQRHFSCAIYRDTEKCSFRAILKDDGSIENISPEEVVPLPKKYNYAIIPKKLKEIPKGSKIVYCPQCIEVFEGKHKHPGSFVTRAQLKRPSRFLETIDDQHGIAQFWFSDESLSVISSIISSNEYDGVLCMGAPRLFETLRAEKKEGRKLFMLDFDERYLSFFLAKECARYSLLTDFLPDPKAKGRLETFFSGVSRLIIISDPPFGVFVEPLIKSIEAMRQRHRDARSGSSAVSQSIIFLPLFVGKHALKAYDGELWMSDYRVLYSNHKDFSKANKTTVRMFTDLPKEAVDLSDDSQYKLCTMCEKWVSITNKHCGMCGDCTSKDGQRYRHCDRCMRCFKESYTHCKPCSRCHLAGRCPIEIEKLRAIDKEKMDEWEEQRRQKKLKWAQAKLERKLREKKEREERWEAERIRKEKGEDEDEGDEDMDEDEEEGEEEEEEDDDE